MAIESAKEKMKSQGEDVVFETGKDYSEDVEDEKQDAIDSYLEENDILLGNIKQAYYKVTHPSEPSWEGIGELYLNACTVLGDVIERLKGQGKDEQAEILSEHLNDAIEVVNPTNVDTEVATTRRHNTVSHGMKKILEEHSFFMRGFSSFVFSGTIVTSEKDRGGSNLFG